MAKTTTGAVDEAFIFIAAISILLFIGIVFLMVYFLVRYRRSRNPVAVEIPGNAALEVLWIAVPTVIALAMFVYGLTGYRFLRNAPEGSLEIRVHSRQWSFLFEYENGVKVPDLVVPSGRNVHLSLTSDDVIHAFYLPAYRVQIDTVPGMTTTAWFKAGAVGSSDILCAQYCGREHSSMLAKLHVLPPADYATWSAGGKVELAGAPLPAVAAKGVDLLRQRGCLACHSTDGTARAGPTFKGLAGSKVEVRAGGSSRLVAADSAFLRRSILDPAAEVAAGFPNTMPSGKDLFTEAELDEAVRAIEGLK